MDNKDLVSPTDETLLCEVCADDGSLDLRPQEADHERRFIDADGYADPYDVYLKALSVLLPSS